MSWEVTATSPETGLILLGRRYGRARADRWCDAIFTELQPRGWIMHVRRRVRGKLRRKK